MARQDRQKQKQFSFNWENEPDEQAPSGNRAQGAPPDPAQGWSPPRRAPAPSGRPSPPPSAGTAPRQRAVPPPMHEEEEPAHPPVAADAGSIGRPQTVRRAAEAPAEDRTPSAARLQGDLQGALTVGQLLQEARNQVGLSVAAVANATKVPPAFVYSIEGDQLDRLPALVYSKSHIKHLCRAYGMEPDPVIEKFLQTVGAASEPKKPRQPKAAPPQTEKNGQVTYRLPGEDSPETKHGAGWTRGRVGAVAVVALLLLAIAYVMINKEGSGDGVPPAGDIVVRTEREIDYEQFVPPQVLPLKQLPMPR